MDVWSHGTCKVYRIHRTELPLVGALQAGTTLIFPSPQTYLFLIEGKLLHNIVLASAIHPYESATGIPVSLPSLTFLPPPTPSCPSRSLRNPGLSSLSYTVKSHWLPILLVVVYTLPCNSLHPSHHLLPSPPVSVSPQPSPRQGLCFRSVFPRLGAAPGPRGGGLPKGVSFPPHSFLRRASFIYPTSQVERPRL